MDSTGKYTILIIDDNDVSRSMLRHILSSEVRYKILGEAGSGKLGLDMAERHRPDIVCLDIHMQDSNGLDILRQIKTRWPQIIVLMVTGNNDRASIVEAVQGGASGYLVKPFNPAGLLSTIEQAIAKARAQ
ncbi:MAG TPA: response regulator transcription factor [Burkholderiaceae bacterium]|jgi:two-component system chemotaxis response regulator CheY